MTKQQYKVLFLQGHEVDKLNLFSEISKLLINSNINYILTAFNMFERDYYKKKELEKIDYIPKLLKKYNINNLKEYKKYDNLDEIMKFNLRINELNGWKVDKIHYVKIVKLFLEYLSFKLEEGVNKIVIWNNTFLFERIAYFFAKKNNIDLIVLEQGLFRPFTLTMDKSGVNYENSIPRNREFYENIIYDKNLLDNYLNVPKEFSLNDFSNKNDKEIYLKIKSFLIENIFAKTLNFYEDCSLINEGVLNKIKRKFNKKISYEENFSFSDKDEYIFVPFQVHDDSQIILNSPNIHNMEQLVEILENTLGKIKSNIKFIIKEHPADKERVNYSRLYDKYRNNNRIIFINNISTEYLISKCSCIITVNSTVGIEALIQNKKVITLGNAFYNIDGIVNNCSRISELSDCIEETLKINYDTELRNKFLYYLRFVYQHEIFWRNPSKDQLNKIVQFILK